MFFKFQNFSNLNAGSPFAMAFKPLLALGGILVVLGLLITAYPELFAGLIAFLLYFLAAICFYFAFKLWSIGRKFKAQSQYESHDGDFGSDNSDSVKIDVTVIE